MKFTDNADDSSKIFLRLKDKESAVGVFRGDPHTLRKHWIDESNGKRKPILCTESTCPHCKAGDRARFSFTINFLTKEGDGYVARIFEQGSTVYTQLKNLHESDYDLEKTVVRISRSGTGRDDTTYSIIPLPGANGQINAAQEAKLALVKLIDPRNPVLAQTEELASPPSGGFNTDDIPF